MSVRKKPISARKKPKGVHPRYVYLVVSKEHGIAYGGEWEARLEDVQLQAPVERIVRARLDPIRR